MKKVVFSSSLVASFYYKDQLDFTEKYQWWQIRRQCDSGWWMGHSTETKLLSRHCSNGGCAKTKLLLQHVRRRSVATLCQRWGEEQCIGPIMGCRAVYLRQRQGSEGGVGET
ncbi:hypothetical protein PIB30_024294 [Stylosanthes scabra]|uniref:Uncharacterized protein n=1 Tax=Stylosanthes scabra TaxID=79078 RepID=A0ABU6X784_9FABA|nr:hypothetical protein [Stylosanthes scabra]